MRLTLKVSLIAIVSLMLVMSIGSGWTAISKIETLGGKTDDIAINWMPSVKVLAEMKFITTRVRLDGARFILAAPSEQAALSQAFDRDQKELDETSAEYQKMVSSNEEKALWKKFEQHWPAYIAVQKQAMTLAAAGSKDQASKLFDERAEVFHSAVDALDNDIKLNNEGAQVAKADARGTVNSAEWQVWLVSAISALVGLLGITFVVLRVTSPIQKLTAAMKEMASGNLDVKIHGLGRRDEIGDMAYTIGVIRKKTRKMRR